MAWLRLLRISALPSALSNILMAYLVANHSWEPASSLFLLLAASACLYSAGMVLNDLFDYQLDSQQRPTRPLPSGKIKRAHAGVVGFSLLLAGFVFGIVSGFAPNADFNIRPAIVAALLATFILLYNGPLKSTVLGPWLMGSCRSLNILLGASTCSAVDSSLVGGWSPLVWWIALCIGVLIAGATWIGRRETENGRMLELLPAACVISTGLVLLALTGTLPGFDLPVKSSSIFLFLIALIGFPILRTAFTAVATGKPHRIQAAVISVIRSLIILDAAICWLVAPDQMMYAMIVIALLLPSILLGRFISST